MRKVWYSIIGLNIFLLMISSSYAQNPREATSSEAKTSFANIAVTGLNKDGSDGFYVPGLPGYIEMTSTKGDVYYLFIGYDGKLRIVSDVVIGLAASPNTVAWQDASGVLVGLQTLP